MSRLARSVSPFALLLAAGAAIAKEPPIDLASAAIVDLSHAFDDKTLYWPTSPTTFQLERLAYGPTPGGFFYSSNTLCTPEHGGTHLDAPIHFSANGRTADQIPVSQLVAPAVVIDVAAKAAADPDYRLTRDDVAAWEKAHPRRATDQHALVLRIFRCNCKWQQ